jgi:DNA-binding ferritin-like protein
MLINVMTLSANLIESLPNERSDQLRRQAQHCRELADAHSDERTRVMLRSMAKELDEHAVQREVGGGISHVISAA